MTGPGVAALHDLTGRVALVTGGARGLGEAYVRVLHDAGAHVVVTDVLDGEGQALADVLGERARFAHLDVTDEDAWDRVVGRVVEDLGSVDVLVNNAGIANAAPIEHFTLAKWDAVMAVNATGTFLGCRAVVPAMKAAGRGSIVNISSVEGLRGSWSLHGYTASKFAVRGLTKSLAVELGKDGIRVNSVHPGLVRTEMSARIDPEALVIPLGRPGEPADLAGAVLFLASEASAWVTGQEIVVDGGMTSAMPHRG
ncbi:glucose 1-dehydrogenase [Promicromonospora citrea]|uniref:3-alpha-hydroxysteroid dehydrogenase n=1 Tax=Promicromonospora citrea TaxID=43677 RepID=A0A8H9GLC0_9MICO|nr:glucose 1-dehydrogenase [Promicromonospora citrea]GGM34756.1 3-alpha-hydroxysteroid dehydrogenase [Promicromonospora citrea]HEV6951621.1 glucose 1-dehydrogenase [Promicromonospora sp.]